MVDQMSQFDWTKLNSQAIKQYKINFLLSMEFKLVLSLFINIKVLMFKL